MLKFAKEVVSESCGRRTDEKYVMTKANMALLLDKLKTQV